VVLILERKLLNNRWEVGIVEETTLGSDDQVRSALVWIPRGIARRPALHLILLPKKQEGGEED
jgi:hypothetical protein